MNEDITAIDLTSVEKARAIYLCNLLTIALTEPKKFSKELKYLRQANDETGYMLEWLKELKLKFYK